MSCWNNTLLSAGTGWNFRSVSLLLGHIQPVAIENTACKAALCCEEIVLLVAVSFGLALFTFTHQVGFTNSDKPLFHHSLWLSCRGAGWACPSAYCWLDGVRKTFQTEASSPQRYSTHQCTSLMRTAQTFNEEESGETNKGREDKELFVCGNSLLLAVSIKGLSSMSSQPLSNCHRTFLKIKDTSCLFLSLSQ